MPQTRTNGVKVPINADGWNLTADLATMADSVKVYVTSMTKRTNGTASGSLTVATGWLDNGGTITVPAAPFGAGVQYDIQFEAQCAPTITTNGTVAMRVLIDSSATIAAQTQISAAGGQTLSCASSYTITDNVSHTVQPQVEALTQTATLSSGATISFLQVTLVPTVSF